VFSRSSHGLCTLRTSLALVRGKRQRILGRINVEKREEDAPSQVEIAGRGKVESPSAVPSALFATSLPSVEEAVRAHCAPSSDWVRVAAEMHEVR
jgi:hypothetical protein